MSLLIVSNKPTSINDLKYWFDASDVSSMSLNNIGSATASVSSIRDKVNGIDLPSSGSSQPIYYFNKINNCNSIYFQYTNNQLTAPNDRLSSTSITFSSTGSLYTVTKWGTTYSLNGQYAIDIAPSSRLDSTYGDFNIIYLSPTNYSIFSTKGPSFNTKVGSLTGFTPNGTQSDVNSISVDIFSARNSSSSLSKLHNTNAYGSKDGYTNATYSLSTSSNELTIGDYHANTPQATGFKGYFCELIYYTRYLSDVEHEKVIQYLKSKWIG